MCKLLLTLHALCSKVVLCKRESTRKDNIMEFVSEEIVSRRIKSLRTLKGLTQEEMAGKLNVSRSAYIRYEKNPYNVPTKKLMSIANLLDCKIGDFFVAY